MDYLFTRIFQNIVGRASGPFALRLILQPLMATIFAIRDGIKDAREGQPPYFWSLFTEPEHRRERLRTGWKSVGKVSILAFLLDVVYQLIVFRWVYPGEAVIVAMILAVIPYTLLRGPVNRVARHWFRGPGGVGLHPAGRFHRS
jgi:hypothetical protein